LGDSLAVKPEFRATARIKRASSSCCAAKLNPGPERRTFTCRNCGQPCDRVMSEPEEVILRG
jgi:hypothetical protein